MAYVLVSEAIFQCSHGGMTKLGSGNSKLTVGGNPVVTSGMEVGISFAPGANTTSPCTNATTTSPPVLAPCLISAPASSGVATKLTVGSTGVLLDSAQGTTTNTQGATPGTWSISSAGQTKLTAA